MSRYAKIAVQDIEMGIVYPLAVSEMRDSSPTINKLAFSAETAGSGTVWTEMCHARKSDFHPDYRS